MESRKNCRIVIIGGDHYNTYGIVRSLGEEGIKSDVLILNCKSGDSFVLRSRYVGEGHGCVSSEDALSLLERYQSKDSILICCSDEAEELIIRNFDRLSDGFILPVSGDPNETRRLMNKKAIGTLAHECGLTIPKTWVVNNRIIPENVEYPCLTKPLESTMGRKSDIVVCHNRDELAAIIEDPKRCSDFIVQQYIPFEKEISILGAVLHGGEVKLSGCIDKLRTCMIGTSSFAVMVENSLIGDCVEKLKVLMSRSGYRGLFSAEFLKKGDEIFFLEVNFRNDGNTYVATASGNNLPFQYVSSIIEGRSEGSTVSPRYPCYFMLDIEDYLARRRNKVSLLQWMRDVRMADCFLVYNRDDIKPFVKKSCNTLKSLFRRGFVKLGSYFCKVYDKR